MIKLMKESREESPAYGIETGSYEESKMGRKGQKKSHKDEGAKQRGLDI
ncbi:hypothetical protein SLEP1_g52124 [Rubroshorea leprosula]|uniref:Uncharacterized protein n=1 Tax=Rubroshorea leprosula TaxID=152421 RepID=A0AAV5M5A4_9ROSI|nr:hypothetical protein SLEP1_g52124 [Rubroshorea leprosula]